MIILLTILILGGTGCDKRKNEVKEFHNRYKDIEYTKYDGLGIILRQKKPQPRWIVNYRAYDTGVSMQVGLREGLLYKREAWPDEDEVWMELNETNKLFTQSGLSLGDLRILLKMFETNQDLEEFVSLSPCLFKYQFEDFRILRSKGTTDSCLRYLQSEYKSIDSMWYYSLN